MVLDFCWISNELICVIIGACLKLFLYIIVNFNGCLFAAV